MRILVIGSGGREHALGWKLKQSPRVTALYFFPGNGGTAELGENITLKNASNAAIVSWVKKNRVDYTVIGPDDYLAQGLADVLLRAGRKVFGPTRAAAELEWSKAFAKRFMAEEGIPTAAFKTFSDIERARQYVRTQNFPVVIKADGLALGKGVVIAETLAEVEAALHAMMLEGVHGGAGKRVVIEEYLAGREISVHAFCDGERVLMFPSSQDHKRIYDGDRGPNTGGVGVVGPLPWVSDALMEKIRKTIVLPAVRGLRKRGRVFRGVLYPGIMVTKEGPKVIEFNARFGDPETEVYMRLLKNDLLDILLACSEGKISRKKIAWENRSACTVVLTSGGYPAKYKKGILIESLEAAQKEKDVVIFHAGTRRKGNEVYTDGGRVLNITATGKGLKEALAKAYRAVSRISFDGMQFRKDIGRKSLK